MKFVIDRIENSIAVCENIDTREMFELNIDSLPKKIKEGSVIIFDNNIYMIEENETEKRRKRIEDKINNLWE